MVKGSVTISTKDYHELLDAGDNYLKLKENTILATKELQVFLSFLCSREDMSNYIDEFNRQSQTCTIVIEDGKARIQLNEKT